jgi:hypothetical protein
MVRAWLFRARAGYVRPPFPFHLFEDGLFVSSSRPRRRGSAGASLEGFLHGGNYSYNDARGVADLHSGDDVFLGAEFP